jgi:hypothetical protein
MNDNNQNLETVLRGLREAHPEPSLELRIAQALRDARLEPAPVSWFGSWSLALGIAGAMVACVVFVAILQRSPRDQRKNIVAHQTASTQQMAPPQPSLQAAGPVTQRDQASVPHAVHTTREEGGSMAQVESFPAPPMPLTEQERLLIRLAHRDDPVQLARLAPGPRAARYQAEKDQVSEFFKPPETPAPPDTNLMESGGGTQ